MAEGVDWAFGGFPGIANLRSAGKVFAGRYVVDDMSSDGGRGITAEEYTELTAAGIDVFVYFERDEGWMRRGFDEGVSAATTAQANLIAAGMPATMPIYFAHDRDPDEGGLDDVDACLRGAASIIGVERTGIYGGRNLIDRCREVGTAMWFCETEAWSRDPNTGEIIEAAGIHLLQYGTTAETGSIDIGGVNVDLVRARQENYGQASKFGPGAVRDWPEGMDLGLAQRWYGRRSLAQEVRRFDESAAECLLWKQLGGFPRLLKVERFDTREYLRFADGTIIWRPNDQDPYRIMGPSGPDGSLPEGMDVALARRWFRRVTLGERTYHFSPNGPVSRRWLESGKFAQLTAVEEAGGARSYIFANGMVVQQPAPGAAPVLLAGTADGTLPGGLTVDRATHWFGSAGGMSFDSDDRVRQLWFSLGRFPALTAVERYDDRTYLRFADGSIIWRANDAAMFRRLA
jgi:hypothetical protein